MSTLLQTRLQLFNHSSQQTQQLEPDVSALRQRLLQLEAWPAAGDIFLNLLPKSPAEDQPVTEADNQWLSKVLDDTLQGVDIGQRYPSFFQKLILNGLLRQAFLHELDKRLS